MTRPCKVSSTTPSTEAFSAQLAEPQEYKNRHEAWMIENQCTLGLTAEAKELQEKLAGHEKTDAAWKTAPKSCGKKRAIIVVKRVATLAIELANAKASYSRLAEVATSSEADANKK